MNKKQIICLWIGIVIFAFVGLTAQIQHHSYSYTAWNEGSSGTTGTTIGDAIVDISNLLVRWVVILVITSGLIYTFRDKKAKKPKDEQNQ
jgi:uncharacterized membrane protein